MSPKSYYQLLQVDPSASPEVITAAYRRLAKLYHPDINQTSSAVEMMKLLNEAYQVLNDPYQRRQYNEYLRINSDQPSTHRNQHYAGSSHSRRTSHTEDRQDHHQEQWQHFPATCQKCGQSDSSLRIAGFPYVVSIIFLTFRRSWGGLYCRKCRVGEMRKAKFLTMLVGWWGFPFGFFYTLGVLFKPNEGDIPADANAEYLRGLGGFFLNNGRLSAAEEALRASLSYGHDEKIATAYREIFGKQPDITSSSDGGSTGSALFGVVAIAAIVFIIWLLMPTSSGGYQNGSSNSMAYANTSPTRAGAIAVLTPTATPTPRPTATAVDATEDQPSAGKLRESSIRPTPKPTQFVVTNAEGYDWVRYSSPNLSILYPNGWDIDKYRGGVFISAEDYSFELMIWDDFEEDISWMFEYDNQQSTLMQSMIRDIEQEYSDAITENLGEIDRFELYRQTELGGMPTLGGYVYELEVSNNWEDGDTLYFGFADVLCSPSRMCRLEHSKIDESFTERDWALLGIFAESIEFK